MIWDLTGLVIDALQINWYDFIRFLLFVAAKHIGIEQQQQQQKETRTKNGTRDINKRFTIILDNMLHLTHFHIRIHTQRESM